MLSAASQQAWQQVNNSWKSRQLLADFASHVARLAASIYPDARQVITRSVLEETTERWATHPSAERIQCVEGIEGMLQDSLDGPASELFSDFGALSERVTQFHYAQTMGDERDKGVFISSEALLEAAEKDGARSQARRAVFPSIDMPSRWFVLGEASEDAPVHLSDTDASAQYWTSLVHSVNRYAALDYLRFGGKIQPESFHLSSSSLDVVEQEVARSRVAVQREIDKLRILCRGNGSSITGGSSALRAAYCAVANEQAELLELRHQWVAAGILLENLHRLPAADAAYGQGCTNKALRDRVGGIVTRLHYVEWPLSGTASTVAAYLLDGATLHALESMEAYPLAGMVLGRADEAAEALLGELCVASGVVAETK